MKLVSIHRNAISGALIAAFSLSAAWPSDGPHALPDHRAAGHLVERDQLTLAGARAVLDAATSEARRRGVGGSYAVVDAGGHLLLLERLDGTVAATPPIATAKARSAALFQKPTSFFEQVVNDGRTAMITVPDFVPLQGGVPIVAGGQVVGAIGVSGAASAAQDEELALVGARALEAKQ